MPLNPREQVEKSVLKLLKLHARSHILLKTAPETALQFGSPTLLMLSECVIDMFRRNLFRVIPVPGSPGELLSPVGALSDPPPQNWGERAKRMFEAGISVMITSEGTRRLEELRRSTTEIRKEMWKRDAVDNGARWTGKVQEH